MGAMDEYYQGLSWLAAQIPEMATLFLGMVLSLAQWRKLPRPALLSFLGFGLLLVVTILFHLVMFFLPIEQVLFVKQNDLFVTCALAVKSFLFAGAYMLLIFAIYAARKPRAPLPPLLPAIRTQGAER